MTPELREIHDKMRSEGIALPSAEEPSEERDVSLVAAASTGSEDYTVGFGGEGLVMRLRIAAVDECHDDPWLKALLTQSADEIERLLPNRPE